VIELTLEALAKRVEALEKKLAEREPPRKDWRQSVGMFDDDPEFMQQVIAEGQAAREADRTEGPESSTTGGDAAAWLAEVREFQQRVVAARGPLPDSTPDIAAGRMRDE